MATNRHRNRVQRNDLPAANILWTVPETNSTQAYTVARMLEDVNRIIPLEAEHWGLEHYVVEMGGFECLHFSPIAQTLKEDDHVSIRPLMTAEVRARTLTGRHQISDDGRHLVDGIPFGRPYLKHPHRPAVHIPPRKRRRLDEPEAEEENVVVGLLTAADQEVDAQSATLSLAIADTQPRLQGAMPRNGSRTVQFKQPEVAKDDDDDDSDDDDDNDFAPDDNSEDNLSMEDESEDDSESDSDSDSEASSSASDSSGSDSDSDTSSGSESDTDSDSDASSLPDILSSKDGLKKGTRNITTPKHTTPGEGLTRTKSRNARRTKSNRLRKLKESGELHQDADLADLQRYEDSKMGYDSKETPPSRSFAASSGKRKRIDEDVSGEPSAEEARQLEQRKRELMAKLSDETTNTNTQMDHLTEHKTSINGEVASLQEDHQQNHSIRKEVPSKRLRPDTAAISRILARQAARPTVKKAKDKPAPETTPEPEGASDPDFWKSKINLSAFECWEEDFELSAPPFPFQQHWDPASKQMRELASTKKKRRGDGKKEVPRPSSPLEEEEENIVLDYDDSPVIEKQDAEIDAAVEDQLREDVAIAAEADLPALPEDIGTLPSLTSSDIKEGAIIVCKFFAVNPVTITPEISDYKTAVIEREGDSGNGAGTIRLRIAQRDLPKKEKKFDSKGNRLYDAGDGFFMDDDEQEDDGLWEGQFTELLEGKLLKAA